MTPKKISIRVIEILDDLAEKCRVQQGDAAAMAFRNSVRAVCLEDGVCNCLEIGGVVHEDHWLISVINRKLSEGQTISRQPPPPAPKLAAENVPLIDAQLAAFTEAVLLRLSGSYYYPISTTKLVSQIKGAEVKGSGKYPSTPACHAFLKARSKEEDPFPGFPIEYVVDTVRNASVWREKLQHTDEVPIWKQ
jgi:hypothetical protein